MSVRGFDDYSERELRRTDERLDHIERRPEMVDQLDRIAERLLEPEEVRVSDQVPKTLPAPRPSRRHGHDKRVRYGVVDGRWR